MPVRIRSASQLLPCVRRGRPYHRREYASGVFITTVVRFVNAASCTGIERLDPPGSHRRSPAARPPRGRCRVPLELRVVVVAHGGHFGRARDAAASPDGTPSSAAHPRLGLGLQHAASQRAVRLEELRVVEQHQRLQRRVRRPAARRRAAAIRQVERRHVRDAARCA